MKIKPILTEKSLANAKKGKYTFAVPFGLTKRQIKRQVELLLGVHVVSIRTINLRGGKKTNFRGQKQVVKNRKKAVIVLKGDEKIDLFEDLSAQAGKGKK